MSFEFNDFIVTYAQFSDKKDPYYVTLSEKPTTEEMMHAIQYTISFPLTKKSLIVTDSHDAVINLNLLLNKNQMEDPYKNGNRVSRDRIYNLFGLPNIDQDYIYSYKDSNKELRRSILFNYLKDNTKLSKENINSFIRNNIDYEGPGYQSGDLSADYKSFHALIDLTLRMITGYDLITLKDKRYSNLGEFENEVLSKLQNNQDIARFLRGLKFSEELIKETQPAMEEMLKSLRDFNIKDKSFFKEMIVNNGVSLAIHKYYNNIVYEKTYNNKTYNNKVYKSFCEKYSKIFYFEKSFKNFLTDIPLKQAFNTLKENYFQIDKDNKNEIEQAIINP